MTQSAYLLLGLTALVAALVSAMVFAVLRFGAAARDASRRFSNDGAEVAFMTAALQEAVTKLRAQERAMKERAEASERLSGEIIASLTSGLLVVDDKGNVVTLNPAGQRLLGRSVPPAATFRAMLGAGPLTDVVEECLSTGRPIVRRALEMKKTGPGSGPTHLGVGVSPITDSSGARHGAICLFTDLTAIIDLEEQLRLKDTLARLGELTAGIAHEFRNGLATIHGYSRLLDLDKLPAASHPYVLGIREETESLGQIVTNFLNFARPAQLTLTTVDLQVIAERAADEIRVEAQSRGGEVIVQGDFAMVEGDEVLLRQAFSNLCRNALEACVEAGISPSVVINGAVDRKQGTARVTVTDNGPGIDEAVRDRVFRPFFTTRAKGTGLGLALVQKIIVTHNGRITLERPTDGRTRMQVVLPIAPGR